VRSGPGGLEGGSEIVLELPRSAARDGRIAPQRSLEFCMVGHAVCGRCFAESSVKKTDPNDARNLALYLAKDLLPEVRMKDKTQAQLASLAQTRDTLVKPRTALKNKINNILSAHGTNLEKKALSSEKKLKEVLGDGVRSDDSDRVEDSRAAPEASELRFAHCDRRYADDRFW
jgi:transposase